MIIARISFHTRLNLNEQRTSRCFHGWKLMWRKNGVDRRTFQFYTEFLQCLKVYTLFHYLDLLSVFMLTYYTNLFSVNRLLPPIFVISSLQLTLHSLIFLQLTATPHSWSLSCQSPSSISSLSLTTLLAGWWPTYPHFLYPPSTQPTIFRPYHCWLAPSPITASLWLTGLCCCFSFEKNYGCKSNNINKYSPLFSSS